MSQEIVVSEKVKSLRTMLEAAQPKLAAVAPKHLKVERMVRLLLAAGSRVPAILDCTQESVLAFCMKCSETGLEPIGAGGAWPIPYGKVLTFIPDYRGLVNCAKRGDCIKDAYAEIVREKDTFDYALGMEPHLTHIPARGDRGELEATYCIITFPDNTKRFVVMDKSDIQAIKSRSKAASSGPWKTDEAEMWKKTVVRRAMKPFAGASPELDIAIAADDAAASVLDVTPKAPIAQPKPLKAIEEAKAEPEPDALPMDHPADAEREEKAAEPAKDVAVEPLPENAVSVKTIITSVRPRKGRGPYKVETKGTGLFDVWKSDIYATCETFMESGEQVEITFIEKTNTVGDKSYTNLEMLKVERVA